MSIILFEGGPLCSLEALHQDAVGVEVSQLCYLITLSQYSVASNVVLKRLDSHDIEVDLHLPIEYLAQQVTPLVFRVLFNHRAFG